MDEEISNTNSNNKPMSVSVPVPELGGLSLKEEYYDPESNTNEKDSSCLSFKDSSFCLSESSEEIQAWRRSILKPKKHPRKRKGVPRRAPLR